MPRKRKASLPSSEPSTTPLQSLVPIESSTKPPSTSTSKQNPFKPYPASKVYRLIEPGPTLLVSTGSLADKTHNLMTLGFHMMLQHSSPALLNICLGPWDTSFALLSQTGSCVLAIPDTTLAEFVVDIGNCSGDEVDKWTKFGFEALPAAKVEAPLVGGNGVIANIECVVHDRAMVEKYNLWVLKAVRAWVCDGFEGRDGVGAMRMLHHRGDGSFVVDGTVLDLRGRMVKWREFQD
ncbi:hypothetical protein N7466_005045 [Penicillium verhagenii]|uniref:uncharacterized protein n=1 Tax=Penicillium verhagenii TaxID=1562060 RepID=UPI002545B8C2|nr:uncharacterized protein N7466_005045 [Penicillium verhagenii]KAJ5935498.1 hypothetical protein N7466_005045 [Penicillium verhagenii]